MKRILTILFMVCAFSAHAANPDMITATNIAKVVTTNAVLTGDVTKAAGATTTVLAAGNAANLNSGTLSAARLPALTGAVTTSAGSAATSLGSFSSANLLTALTDETGSGLAVFGTSPTIVTPTIASFANANHTHQNSAGGGVLDAAAIANGTLSDARLSSVLQNLAGTDGAELTHLNASAIDAGTVPAARGGAGTVNGVLAGNGSGLVSAATAAQLNPNSGYTITLAGGWESGTLTKLTNYYFGGDYYISSRLNMWAPNFTNAAVEVPMAGRITRIYVKVKTATVATTETVGHSIRLNDTSNVGSVNLTYNLTEASGTDSTVNQAVVAGDKICLNVATPNWATAAIGSRMYCIVFVSTP